MLPKKHIAGTLLSIVAGLLRFLGLKGLTPCLGQGVALHGDVRPSEATEPCEYKCRCEKGQSTQSTKRNS